MMFKHFNTHLFISESTKPLSIMLLTKSRKVTEVLYMYNPMLHLLFDNIFVVFEGKIFQHILHIPRGAH